MCRFLSILFISFIHFIGKPTSQELKDTIGHAVWDAAIQVNSGAKSIPGKRKQLKAAVKPIYQCLVVCTIDGCSKCTWKTRMRYHNFVHQHLTKTHQKDAKSMTDQQIMNCMQIVSYFKPADDTNKLFEFEYRFVDANDLSAIVVSNNNNINNQINNNPNDGNNGNNNGNNINNQIGINNINKMIETI